MWQSSRILLLLSGMMLMAMTAQSQQTGETPVAESGKPAAQLAASSQKNPVCTMAGQPDRNVQAAVLMAQSGDFKDSIAILKAELKCEPHLAGAHYDLGLALLGAGNTAPTWTKAMEQFRAALRIQPKYPQARNMLGVGLLVSGDPEGSIKELQIAAKEDPEMGEIHLNLGKALAAVGRWDDAINEFRKAIALRHPYPEAEAQLGNALLSQGKKSAAADAFLTALRNNPDIEIAHYGLARTLQAEGKTDTAQVEFAEARALLQQKSNAVMSSNLSNQSLSLAAHGKPVQAVDMAKRAVELEPDNWIAIYNYGLLLADTGKLSEGIDEVRKAISLMPMQRRLYLTMAQMQRQSGHADAAACTLSRANHLLQLAALHDGKSAQALATEKCQASEQKFAFGAAFGNVDRHCAYAEYLSAKGDLPGASGELLYSVKLAPSRADLRYSLAIVWLQMGKLQDAELELQKVLILSPQSAKAHFALGAILVERKDYKDAKVQLSEALHLNPRNQEARRMLDEISGQNKDEPH